MATHSTTTLNHENGIESLTEILSNNDLMFLTPDEGTPAAEALAANAALKVSKVTKGLHKLRGGLKVRPKMKNLNIVKRLKKHTKQKRKKHFTTNFKGKVIDGVHELYTLTAGMMLGMRCTIGRSQRLEDANLTLEDFNHVEKLVFPAAGNSKPPFITPPHTLVHTFKFKSYSPKVFRRLREFFGIDSGGYMMSVCGNYNYLEFISNSKSGQFFFYSHDGKYMIKTQTKEENKFMIRILPHYYRYITGNPNSMLVRILGMHRVKMYHLRRKVHFVIMSSVFDTAEEIHTIYDLKGSLIGRQATVKDREEGGVLKDMDLLLDKRKFHLGDKKAQFMEQLAKDSHFLATLNIMDYSLLVGIHDRSKRETAHHHSVTLEQATTVQLQHLTVPSGHSHSNTPFRRNLNRPTHDANDDYSDSHSSYSDDEEGGGAYTPRGDGEAPPELKRHLSSSSAVGQSSDDHHGGAVRVGVPVDISAVPGHQHHHHHHHRHLGRNQQPKRRSGTAPAPTTTTVIEAEHDGLNHNAPVDSGLTPPRSPHRKSAKNLQFSSEETAIQHHHHHQHLHRTRSTSADVSDEHQQQDDNLSENSEGEELEDDEDDEWEVHDDEGDSVFGEDGNMASLLTTAGVTRTCTPSPIESGGMDDDVVDGSGLVLEGLHVSKLFRSSEALVSLAKYMSPPVSDKGVPAFTFGPGLSQTHPWTARKDCGINSRNMEVGGRGSEIYYVGVIDILQQYNLHKQCETFFKGFTNDRTQISSVDAKSYATRFVKFMDENID